MGSTMITRNSAIVALAGVAMLFSLAATSANRQDAIAAKNAAKSGDGARLSASLAVLERAAARRIPQSDVTRTVTRKLPALRASGGYVSISAYGDDLAGLRAQLVSKGLKDATQYPTAISGRAPVAALRDMAATPGLKFLRPTMAMARAGTVTSQGDRSLRANLARREAGVNGRGIAIGALSDSFDCAPGAFEPGAPFTRAADDVASNDLPRVRVLKDLSDEPSEDCSDEGRAMLQLIHDVAPASPKQFYTAFVSQEDFAAGIRALADAGSEVIVDDVIYFAEPMFEDGIIAQAVDDVHDAGVAYFSSAGNDARLSYESRFRPVVVEGFELPQHDFATRRRNVDTLQTATASAGSVTLLSFQWDQPSLSANGKRGAQSDLDLYFYDANGDFIEICTDDPDQVVCQIPGFEANVGGDAVEIPIMVNLSEEDLEVQIGIELFEGPAPNYIKYVWFDLDAGIFTVDEYDTASSTLYGHANAAGAEAVGAAAWYQTEEWGSPLRPQCIPACLNSFSSAGGTPIFLGKNGRRLHIPEIRLKPGVTGPDGGNTTSFFFDLSFEVPGTTEPDGYPNF